MKTLNKPGLMLFIGILAVSTASLFIREAQMYLPSTLVAAGRLVFATLLLVPFTGKTAWKDFISLPAGQRLRIVLAGIFLGVHFLVWIKSLELTKVASSVILVTTTPIWVALFSPLFLKEKVARNVILGLSIAMIGIAILFIGPTGGFQFGALSFQTLFGNFLALAGAWMAAAYTMVGRSVRDQIDLRSYVVIVYGFAALTAGIAAIPDLGGYTSEWINGLPWLFLLGLIPQVIGHTLFNAAIRKMDAVYASIALLGEPIGSIILAWIFLHEMPGKFDLLGGLCVLAGILLAFLFKKTSQQDRS